MNTQNQENMNQNVAPIPQAEQPTGPTTSDCDLGDGSLAGGDFLKTPNPKGENPKFVEDLDTLPYVNYGDLPLLTTGVLDATANSGYAFGLASQAVISTVYTSANCAPTGIRIDDPATRNLMDAMLRNQPVRPIECVRGTNILVPFGAAGFLRECAKATYTSSIPTSVDEAYQQLNASLRGNQTYRELENWKAVDDQKNVVINYFNRSIPFTDLSTGNRFGFMIAYMRDIANLALPFIAYANVLGIYKWYKDHHIMYRPVPLVQLYDPTILDLFTQIYKEIADLPVLDDVLMERLNYLGTPHSSSEESGLWGAMIRQDVMIDQCPEVASLRASSAGYSMSGAALSNSSITLPTLINLEYQLLMQSTNSTITYLNSWLAFASSLRTRYAMLLGYCMQMEGKGAVKYSRLQEYLPVSGIDILHPKFTANDVVFDYAYKERFEYAPQAFEYEVGSANQSGVLTLGNLPAFDLPSFYSEDKISFMRPIGPYHQASAWRMDEVIDIGVFKVAVSDPAGGVVSRLEKAIKSFYNTTLVTSSNTSLVNNGTSTSSFTYTSIYCSWVDTYFGDFYEVAAIVPKATTNQVTTGAMLQFQGVGQANLPAPHVMQVFLDQVENFPSADAAFGAARFLAYVANQLDLTNLLFIPKKSAGSQEIIAWVMSGYRQTMWDTFDITLLGNVLHTSAAKLATKLVRKNVKQQAKGDFRPTSVQKAE